MYHTFVLSPSPALSLCATGITLLLKKKKKKIINSLFASLLFPAFDLYCIYINFFSFYPSFLSSILKKEVLILMNEGKGAFDFGNEVTAAIPRLSPCYLPVFLMEKSVWALQVVKGTRSF